MAHLKSAELLLLSSSNNNSVDSANDSTTTSSDEQHFQNVQNSLQHCIDDCTLALQQLDSTTTSNNTKEEEETKLNLRTKLLYRNAKALVTLVNLPSLTSLPSSLSPSTSTSSMSNSTKEKKLNEAAKLLLQLLQLQPNNKEASLLLNQVREIHTSMNTGSGSSGSRVGKALDYLNILTSNNNEQNKSIQKKELPKDDKGKEITILDCLHILQGSLSDDISSTSSDIGNYEGGVQLLLQIARYGIPPPTSSIKGEEREHKNTQCRLAALHILSACCSTDTFILQYANRNILSPNLLAQIVEEEASSSSLSSTSSQSKEGTREGAADIAVATIALLVRLIVHYDHYEIIKHFTPKILDDGTIEELSDLDKKKLQQMQMPEVDGSVICRVAIAAFLWGTNGSGKSSNEGEDVIDTRPPRAALDLLSAWTASDLDALDAASDACFAPTSSDSNSSSVSGKKKASQHFLSPEDIRRMKPRQVSTHRKREGEFTRYNLSRAIQHISTFCNDQSGGLNSMLICASKTIDHRLRREVGLQIGRMMSVYVENDDVKKLIYRELGCNDWTVGKDEEEKEKENVGQTELSTLTIEELDDEEGKEMDESSEESKLLTMMKRGQLTASLIMGKPDVGTWALKYGWSNGQGVEELKQLISSNNSCAMSIASELVSAASSVERSRPLLATLVQEGTLEDLLIHPDADVRSGAASCAAKIGLASKALSSDNGEVMGLLDVAIELLFEEDEWLDDNDQTKSSSNKSKVEALTKKVPMSRKASGESTSMDRGIEVLAYLVSKTFVKEKVVGGYKPEGSPADRKTALERLVEIACAPSSGDAQLSYGLASVFNLLAVSIETLRKEAFIGKEITREQYDQLQALGKTEEEKEAEAKKDEKEGDNPASVSERIRKLASCNVPRAMVKLLEGSSSDTTQDKLLEGMCRMASEPTVRGLMIQQGCLTTCLQLDKGVSV